MAILPFRIVQGHQVASGIANDPRFPAGTIAAQQPYFLKLGLDLKRFHLATINAEFNCDSIVLNHVDYQFKQVKWHKEMSAEDFVFIRCKILANEQYFPGFIYQPQPATKTEHFQAKNQLELLAPFIENINYGDTLALDVADAAITLVL